MHTDFDKINIYELWLGMRIKSGKRYDSLMKKYGNAKLIYENLSIIKQTDPNDISEMAYKSLSSEPPEKLHSRMRSGIINNGIDVLLKSDVNYPEKLKKCEDSPNVLFARGVLPNAKVPTVGIVGTRNYTAYGAEVTTNYAYNIGQCGGVIVSGMALGIDTLAAKSALRASDEDCATIAVLGSGIDIPTPMENVNLYHRIIENGVVVSQFPPGFHATRYTYPMRNKVIAGLSDVLLVTEAGEKSGALITAEAAKKYGRDVYAVPGRMYDNTYIGVNKLLEECNAKYAPAAEKFFTDVFGIESIKIRKKYDINGLKEEPIVVVGKEKSKNFPEGLDEVQEKIYNALKQGEKCFDELCVITGIDVGLLNLQLTMLEMRGLIVQKQGRVYGLH